ncbi:MAG TPA: hypothetical protein VFQ92_10860, partial [Blastocatellia bacterium]|nr:hypothetical protein [Blastocatellia bacterium]
DEKVKPETKAAIEALRKDDYDKKEKDICCKWIELRSKLTQLYDCLRQAEKREEESKDDYEAMKGFEKTLTDRFTEMKSLYDKAKALRDGERHKSVCAVGVEFAELYDNLSAVRNWAYWQGKCGEGAQPRPGKDPKQEWPPDRFKSELTKALRALILAKYQRFRWQNQSLEIEVESKKYKEACDKFRKGRRDEFTQEAEDIEA